MARCELPLPLAPHCDYRALLFPSRSRSRVLSLKLVTPLPMHMHVHVCLWAVVLPWT